MSELARFLRANALERYEELLVSNDIDVGTLRILTEHDLETLGLPFGARKRLLAALKSGYIQDAGGGDDEQRRQLTVLFCDIAGYTGLAARHDPEILTGIVRGYEDLCAACVTRYEGYLFQRLGDGIVAFFGYPVAHEREAERAIRAAQDILKGASGLRTPLDLRIGIATGIVVISSGGRMAIGDAMNLASRLQSLAEPGAIVVSSTVRKLAGATFRFSPLGDIAFKGFPKPVPTYRVDGAGAASARPDAPGDSPPIGRDDDLSLLAAPWETVRTAGRGHIAGISGEPGIGKSRIAAALCGRIVTAGVGLMRFQCSPFHAATPLYPVISHLEALMAFQENPPPEERLARIEALVCGRCGLASADARFIAALMSVPFAQRLGAIGEPPRLVKAETLRVLMAIFAALCSSGPTLMLFEDLHWADATTLEVVDLLAARLPELPVLVVATYRPEFAPRWSERPDCSLMALSRLTPEQSRAMILACTQGKALPPAVEDIIIAKTDGVPLFLEEMVRAVIESGQLKAAGDRYIQASGTVDITLPDTLRGSLMVRLDRLAKAKRVAQVGAVIGRSFSRDCVSALAHEPEIVDEGLAQLVSAGLAYVSDRRGGQTYMFKHALVQEAAYDSLLLRQRKRLHRRMALLTERDPGLAESQPELVARHLSAAGADAKAVPMWLKAAEMAMQRFAVSEAASHLRKGLSQISALPVGPARDALELRYRAALGPAVVAERGWGHPELSDVLEPALRLATALDNRKAYLPILNALWVHTMCTDQLALSVTWAERMLRLSEEKGSGDLAVVAHRALSGSCFWAGELTRARRHGDILRTMYDPEKHWHVAEQTNTDPLTGEVIYRGQYLWMLGYPDQAVAASNARDEHARRRGHPFDLAFSLTLGAQVFDFLGEADELESRAEEAIAIGRRFGVPLFYDMLGEISRGVAWLRAGRYAEAAGQIERSVTRLASTGHRIWLSYLQTLRGEALALMGDLEAAGQAMDENIASIEQGEQRCHFAEMLRLRGWLAGLQGDEAKAEALFRRALAVARSQQAKSWELRAASSLAELLIRKGEPAAGLAELGQVYDWFREGFDTKDLRAAARLLGRHHDRPPQDGTASSLSTRRRTAS